MEPSAISIEDLKDNLERLAHDFKITPDYEKDFDALQLRLENLLAQTSKLSREEREPLLPILKTFQVFLQDHLKNLQEQVQSMVISDESAPSATQAVNAYASRARTTPKSFTSKTG